MVYSVTVCCSGCQMPPGSAHCFASFSLTGRLLRIYRRLTGAASLMLYLQAQVPSLGSGAVRAGPGWVLRPWPAAGTSLTSMVRTASYWGRAARSHSPGWMRNSKHTFGKTCCTMCQTCPHSATNSFAQLS